MRELQQRAVLVPHALRHHLRELHRRQRGRQPAAARDDIDDGLQQPRGVGQDRRQVVGQVAVELHAPEVRLQQRGGLDVRVRRAPALQRDGRVVQHVPQRARLARARGVPLKLRCAGDNLQQPLELGLRRQGRGEELDRGVRDGVVRADHAEVERRDVHVVLHRDALARLQIRQRRLHQLGERVREVPVRRARQVVVVGVLAQAPVVERPRQVVHRVLLVLHHLRHDLRGQVVVQEVVQVRLHRERLVQELLVVRLARRVAEEHRRAVRVERRTRRAPAHRQQVGDGVVRGPGAARVEVLRARDHHHPTHAAQPPGQRRGRHQHRGGARREDALHRLELGGVHALVRQRDAEPQGVCRRRVGDALEVRREVLRLAVQEPARRAVRGGERQQVQRQQLGVLPRGHEHDRGRAVWRVPRDGAVRRPRHGAHARLEVGDVHALDVYVQRHGAHARREVEDGARGRADPLADVPRVREGDAQPDDARRALELRADVAHPAHRDFRRRPVGAADQVQLVRDEQRHRLHVLALLPPARKHVPLARGRDHDRALRQKLQIHRSLPGERGHGNAERAAEARAPVARALARNLRRGRHVHALLRRLGGRFAFP